MIAIKALIFFVVMLAVVRVMALVSPRFSGLLTFAAVAPKHSFQTHERNMFAHQAQNICDSRASEAVRRFIAEEKITALYPVDRDGVRRPAGWHLVLFEYWLHPRSKRAENRYHEAVALAKKLGYYPTKETIQAYRQTSSSFTTETPAPSYPPYQPLSSISSKRPTGGGYGSSRPGSSRR